MKTGKKIFSALLVFVMITTAVPVFAEELLTFPEGTLFLHVSKVANFFNDNWKSVWRTYEAGYSPLSSVNSGVEGPYAVFTAPKDGTYDVWMQNRTNSANQSNRTVAVNISGTDLSFNCGKSTLASSAAAYSWNPEQSLATVTFKKGQQVVVRLMPETGYFGAFYGIAFVPKDSEGNRYDMSGTATPGGSQINTVVGALSASNPVDKTVNVKIGTETKSVTAGAAEALYPNIRKYDANGNYISQPTLLDALATENGLVTLKPDTLVNNVLSHTVTSNTVTALNNETNPSTWVGQNPTASVYPTVLLLSANASQTFTVTAPKAENYYLIGSAYAHENSDGRYLEVKVNNVVYKNQNGTQITKTNATGAYDKFVCTTPIPLNEGENTIQLTAKTGAVRVDYLGFVGTADASAAETINNGFTTKAAVNAYFASCYKDTFVDGDLYVDGMVTVNGAPVMGRADQYLLQNDDVIDIKANASVTSMEGRFTAIGGVGSSDAVSGDNVKRKFNIGSYNNHAWPVAVTEDAFNGWYLNGYTEYLQEKPNGTVLSGVTGNPQDVRIYTHNMQITDSAVKSDNTTLQFGINEFGSATVTLGDKVYPKQIYNGSIAGDGKSTNFTNLYLTNFALENTAKVTAIKTEIGFILRSNVTMPITILKVTTEDGVITEKSAEVKTLDFMSDGYFVPCAENQTIYVWEGTILKASGTTMKPLLAPLSK